MTEEKKEEKTKKVEKSAKKVPERAKLEDVEKLVLDIAKTEKSPAKIGEIMKKKHGIQKTKILGKKISKILKDNNINYQSDLDIVNARIAKIDAHFSKNKQDKHVKRDLIRFIGLRKKLEIYGQKQNKTL